MCQVRVPLSLTALSIDPVATRGLTCSSSMRTLNSLSECGFSLLHSALTHKRTLPRFLWFTHYAPEIVTRTKSDSLFMSVERLLEVPGARSTSSLDSAPPRESLSEISNIRIVASVRTKCTPWSSAVPTTSSDLSSFYLFDDYHWGVRMTLHVGEPRRMRWIDVCCWNKTAVTREVAFVLTE